MPVASRQAGILEFASHAPPIPHSHVPALHIFAVASQATPPQRHDPLVLVNPAAQITVKIEMF